MENNTVLSVVQIRKNYGTIPALKGVSLEVPCGTVFGILGPNGSGKTTLLGILLDVLKAQGGTYHWTAYAKAEDARKQIGALLETPNFYHYLHAVDNLKIVAEIKHITQPDFDGVLKRVGLFERRLSPFSSYSLGMKQRLAIASCLLNNPSIIVFDEPTNGLDPEGIAEIRNLIKELHAEGKTIIMASHLLDEVEKVCTHVAILKKGELLSAGPVQSILTDEPVYELAAFDKLYLQSIMEQHPAFKSATMQDNTCTVSFHHPISAAEINQYCFEHHVVLSHLKENKQNLEKTFLELIK